MKITTSEALELLQLSGCFDLRQLKDSYRRELRHWHPDLHPDRANECTEHCKRLNAAYDLLERSTDDGDVDADWLADAMPEWEACFKDEWKAAYTRSMGKARTAGLEFNTCIEGFRRYAVRPPKSWFRNVLHKDSPKSRTQYRNHLIDIAPSRTMAEVWARKYYVLEFGEGSWVFYLPGSEIAEEKAA